MRLRVAPRASANRLAGLVEEPDGSVALRVMVTAAAEDGKANAAVVTLLSQSWHIPRSRITIVSGAADRRKVVHIAADAAQLLPVIEATIGRPDKRYDVSIPPSRTGRRSRYAGW